MNTRVSGLAQKMLKRSFEELTAREKSVVRHIARGVHISRNTNKEYDESLTFGQRVADKVASFGGSWTFILIFCCILVVWVVINSALVLRHPFDPYPYILLNLFLSMLAAVQAPIIMMSQNRQAAKDRVDAAEDYEVNLKAELEIAGLHEKLDELRSDKWLELLRIQQEQIELLKALLREQKIP
ncbi:MAG: DUF1003 domain-containing protein [Acidobacteriota bacterium]